MFLLFLALMMFTRFVVDIYYSDKYQMILDNIILDMNHIYVNYRYNFEALFWSYDINVSTINNNIKQLWQQLESKYPLKLNYEYTNMQLVRRGHKYYFIPKYNIFMLDSRILTYQDSENEYIVYDIDTSSFYPQDLFKHTCFNIEKIQSLHGSIIDVNMFRSRTFDFEALYPSCFIDTGFSNITDRIYHVPRTSYYDTYLFFYIALNHTLIQL